VTSSCAQWWAPWPWWRSCTRGGSVPRSSGSVSCPAWSPSALPSSPLSPSRALPSTGTWGAWVARRLKFHLTVILNLNWLIIELFKCCKNVEKSKKIASSKDCFWQGQNKYKDKKLSQSNYQILSSIATLSQTQCTLNMILIVSSQRDFDGTKNNNYLAEQLPILKLKLAQFSRFIFANFFIFRNGKFLVLSNFLRITHYNQILIIVR